VGLFDTILGRTKPVRPDLDALFALPSAAVTLETAAGFVLSGHAGVVWKPPAGRSVDDVQQEIAQLLEIDDGPADAATTGNGGDDATAAGGAAPPDGERTAAAGSAATSLTPDRPGVLSQEEDSFGYRWLLLEDADTEQLVTRVHMVNTLLSENGWGPQLLCSVFGVRPAPGSEAHDHRFYLVYLFKRGTFYPFAPVGNQRRDNELELRIRSMLGSDLPVEQDVSRWFPLWDLPVR